MVFTVAVNAQVEYRMVSDDPVNYKLTTLYLNFLTMDTYLGTNFGGALKLETVFGKVMPWIQVNKTWSHASGSEGGGERPTLAGGTIKQTMIEAGAAWYMVDKQVKKDIDVTIYSRTIGRWTIRH